jgi:uncharacterized membrane protein YeiH
LIKVYFIDGHRAEWTHKAATAMRMEVNAMIPAFAYWLDIIGVAVFAATGALAASRKQMDLIGFSLLATLTGIGGGTVRDLMLDRPVFWLLDQTYLVICLAVAGISFFAAHLIQRRYPLLLWLDAIGLASYGVLGADIAFKTGAGVIAAAALGVITATFGGMMRDVVSQETPLILKQELYATAALFSAVIYLAAISLQTSALLAAGLAISCGFGLRAGAIRYGWSLPRYKPREGRSY